MAIGTEGKKKINTMRHLEDSPLVSLIHSFDL